MLVTPGCLGFLMADRFPRMVGFAVASAVLAAVSGTYVSFFLNASTGACIVLVQALLFGVALVLSPRKGLAILHRRGRKTTDRALDPLQG